MHYSTHVLLIKPVLLFSSFFPVLLVHAPFIALPCFKSQRQFFHANRIKSHQNQETSASQLQHRGRKWTCFVSLGSYPFIASSFNTFCLSSNSQSFFGPFFLFIPTESKTSFSPSIKLSRTRTTNIFSQVSSLCCRSLPLFLIIVSTSSLSA